jgi:hypothetical protein
MIRLSIVVMALVLGGCHEQTCVTETVEFELLNPGDAIELRVGGCGPRSELEFHGQMTVIGTPSSPLSVIVDGMDMPSVGPMEWMTEPVFDEPCASSKLMRLQRVDEEPAISIAGSLAIEVGAPVGQCRLTVEPQ